MLMDSLSMKRIIMHCIKTEGRTSEGMQDAGMAEDCRL